jgi:DHA1 family bicyclomycin/chloramphenicol resistance-like MFS transporter
MTEAGAVAGRQGWLIFNLVCQLAFGLVAMTICLPSMQAWPTLFNADQAAVQLTFSGYVAAYGGFQLVYGPLSDRHGRKSVLMAGLVLAFAGSLLAALARDLTLLTAARVLQGAGSAACMVMGRAMVQDLFSGGQRTRVMAFVGMAMGLCPPLATLVGGQMHVRFGWASNFLLMAAAAAVLFVAAWKGLPARVADPGGHAQSGWRTLYAGYARLVREPVFLSYVFILSTTAATFYAFLGGAPIVLGRYGVTPERIGWYIMAVPIAYIFGNLLTTRLIRRVPDRRIMMFGHLATLAGIGVVLALGVAGLRNPLALALPLLLMGIGHGLLVPPTLTGTVGLLPALAGSAAAVAGLLQQLTGALGGFVVGLAPHDGPSDLAVQMLAWAGCGLAGQLVLDRAVRRRAAAVNPP